MVFFRCLRSSWSFLLLATTLLLFLASDVSASSSSVASDVQKLLSERGPLSLTISPSYDSRDISLVVPHSDRFSFLAIRPDDDCLKDNKPDKRSVTFSYGDDGCKMGFTWTKENFYLFGIGGSNDPTTIPCIGKNVNVTLQERKVEIYAEDEEEDKKVSKKKPQCELKFQQLSDGPKYKMDFSMSAEDLNCDVKVKFDRAYASFLLPTTYAPFTTAITKSTSTTTYATETTDVISLADLTPSSSPCIWMWITIAGSIVCLVIVVTGLLYYCCVVRRKQMEHVNLDYVHKSIEEGKSKPFAKAKAFKPLASQEDFARPSEPVIMKKRKAVSYYAPVNGTMAPKSDDSSPKKKEDKEKEDVIVSMESIKEQKRKKKSALFGTRRRGISRGAKARSRGPKARSMGSRIKRIKKTKKTPNYQTDFVPTPAPVPQRK